MIGAAVALAILTGCLVVSETSYVSRDSDRREIDGESQRMASARAIETTLDSLHDAASKADGARYFSLFTDDAVFIGTDATERWPIAEFRMYAQERFNTGTGWTYRVLERNVDIDSGAGVAWFDERLENEKYGECRGTGVLVDEDGQWRIAQYNLTVPVPNDMLADVARQIREFQKSQRSGK